MPDAEESSMAVMPLGAHLEELRRRLIVCLLAVGVAFVVAWIFRERIIAVLVWPHVRAMRAFELDPMLKFQSYLEPVIAQLKACFVVALAVTAPVVIYQVWAFVAPGLFAHERRKTIWLGAACVVCFFAGVCFGYFLFVPVALRYLLLLSGSAAEPVLMIGAYLTTFFMLTLALGVAFQTPIVICFLIRWGVVSVEGLQRARKGVILAAFVVGAFLTPPDPLTQVMMAVTLIILYDLGVLVAAPSRTTLAAFIRFTGSVVLVAGVLVAWFGLRPLAEVEARRGHVSVGETVLEVGRSKDLRRGAVLQTGPGSLARLTFGPKERVVMHVADEARLLVAGPHSVNLLAGEALAANPIEAAVLTVHAGPAVAVVEAARAEFVEAARAEFAVPDQDTLRVTVFEGQVTVKADGATKRISAGESSTFRRGGTPTDVSQAAGRWEERLKPARPAGR